MTRKMKRFVLGCIVITVATRPVRAADEPQVELPEEIKTYEVDVAKVSFAASGSLESYRGGGKLSGSPGATLGTSTPDADVSILILVESKHLYADVTIEKHAQTDANDSKTERIDLTNLRATVVDLGTASDGRTYHLNLIPSVRTITIRPQPFERAADDLYRLRFHQSPVLLNDRQYVGRMLATDAEVISLEICGVASLEMSLRHLKDAEPWGRLQDGQITISHPQGATIQIGNVTNGSGDRLVGNGPFQVWVRWNQPQSSEADYRAQLADYRDRIESGEMTVTEGALAAIERELAREPGPWVIGCGGRDTRKSEIVPGE